ncbi:MAG: DUF2384 domain-containing protein [Opitutaceae bacterium]|nr:DUF2384 domain-containing protein [Opitutaceae bacterium]
MKRSVSLKKPSVVKYYTQTEPETFKLEEPALVSDYGPAALLGELRRGLPFAELEALQSSLEVPLEKLAGLLGISKATLHRRKLGGRLDLAESDRVVRYARLMGLASQVLDTPENARLWLSAPQHGLGGAVPVDYAETEYGARQVEDLLNRIEYGVY